MKIRWSSILLLPIASLTPAMAVSCQKTAEVKVISLNIIPSVTSIIVQTGKTEALSVEVYPSSATNKTVTWSSSDESVATIDTKGILYGVSEGTCEITATANDGSGKSCKAFIQVKDDISPTGEIERYINDRTLSLYCSCPNGGGVLYGTGFIMSDSTPTIYNDYNYYVATNWHVVEQAQVKNQSRTWDLYVGNEMKSLSYPEDYTCKAFFKIEDGEWRNNLYDPDQKYEPGVSFKGIDYYVLNLNLQTAMSSLKIKLDRLNHFQEKYHYVTKFHKPIETSDLPTNVYTAGFPLINNKPTWEYHKMNTEEHKDDFKYVPYASDLSHIISNKTIWTEYAQYQSDDISPQYVCMSNKDNDTFMQGGASGSMLIGDYGTLEEPDYQVIGIYWGGFRSVESDPKTYHPCFSIFRTEGENGKDFAAPYIGQ